ncbi:unnamed protein product [Rotaria sordida]|uniref:Uncharacterized protein n=1 Tax=Rotaria sordida TaxID=392033 RepID=A0A818R478_9BILA|nr:unnamed protein product [Rotaria sordida]CAF3644237.1 unnamed protein product [Rotaria sordida]
MQRSLVELYSLDLTVTYQHGFVFLRHFPIHLRTPIQNKKTCLQIVNFIHALGLWTNVIGILYNDNKEKLIQKVVHLLTELIVGTIRFISTAYYYPLRFHCVRLLIKLTPMFVPLLPFLLEMFDITDFNKRHRTASLKAQYINLDTSLKLTKLQMDDRAFKDGLMDQFYELVMLYLVHYTHHVTFFELVYLLIIKLQENVNLIEERGQKTGLNVEDNKQIDNWLEQSRQQSTSSPLVVHFERYKSLREREAFLRQISTLDRTSLPDLIRPER